MLVINKTLIIHAGHIFLPKKILVSPVTATVSLIYKITSGFKV